MGRIYVDERPAIAERYMRQRDKRLGALEAENVYCTGVDHRLTWAFSEPEPVDMGTVVCVRGHPPHMTRDELQGKRSLRGYEYQIEGDDEWLTLKFIDGTRERWAVEYTGEHRARKPGVDDLMGPYGVKWP